MYTNLLTQSVNNGWQNSGDVRTEVHSHPVNQVSHGINAIL
jgi:hypothetical protein